MQVAHDEISLLPVGKSAQGNGFFQVDTRSFVCFRWESQ